LRHFSIAYIFQSLMRCRYDNKRRKKSGGERQGSLKGKALIQIQALLDCGIST